MARLPEITGLHPGEKLSEILIDDTTETLCPTPFARIGMISCEPFDVEKFGEKVAELEEASWRGVPEEIHDLLRAMNIGFRSEEAEPDFARETASSSRVVGG